ncbi:hypothetical protein RQP46_008894 [Phenoliferia psychrophenolica]
MEDVGTDVADANASAATSSPRFPPEIVERILSWVDLDQQTQRISRTSKKSSRLETLEAASLVSHQFCYFVRPRLHFRLVIRHEEHAKRVIEGIASHGCGMFIRELRFEQVENPAAEVPGADVLRESTMIDVLSLIPDLQSLEISEPGRFVISKESYDKLSKSGALSTVQSLRLRINYFESAQELLRSILSLSTSLSRLSVTACDFNQRIEEECAPARTPIALPNLSILEANGLTRPFVGALLPLESLGSVTTLKCSTVHVHKEIDTVLLSHVGPNLLKLYWNGDVEGLVAALPFCPNLQELVLGVDVEQDHPPDRIVASRLRR